MDGPPTDADMTGLARGIVASVTAHHTLLLASGIAFTGALGIVPALVTVVATYSLIATPTDVEANVSALTDPLPAPARELIVTELQALTVADETSITLGLIIGLAGSVYAVSSVVNAMVMAIRVAHERPSPHTWVQGRLFALRLGVISVVTVAAGLWFIVALPRVVDQFELDTQLDIAIAIGRWPVSILVSSFAISVVYRTVLGPLGGFLGVSAGAFAAAAMWVGSTALLGFAYDNIGRLYSTFTTFGATAALLVWLYLSAVAVVLGAELDHVRARRRPPDIEAGPPLTTPPVQT